MREQSPAIGDNSRHFGEELRAELETVLGDDHEAVFRYAQWHIGDYITGTNGMNLEAEGGYIRFLMRLYQRGKPLPDDDRFMAACMNLSLRVWRRIRDALVGFGKIIARNGCLTNARFEKERQRRAEEMKKKADAANKRWAEKHGAAKVSPKLGANLDETCPKPPENIDEKANKINGDAQKMHMLTNNHYPLKEEVPPLSPPLQGEKKNRARQLEKGWAPSPSTFDWCLGEKIGATAEQVADQFEAFRDYHVSKASRFADWDRAFQTWMRNAKSYGRLSAKQQKRDYSFNGSYIGDLL